MSTEIKPNTPETAPPEEIKNLKAEMNRKFENITSSLKAQNDELKAMLASVTAAPPAAKPEAREGAPLEDLFYKDPAAYTAKVIEEADRRADAKLASREKTMIERQQTIQKLYADYPELGSNDSELTKLAIQKQKELAKEMGETPTSWRLAAFEAAAELGIKPKAKRSSDSDDFTVSGGGSSEGRSRRKKDDLPAETETFAQLMGVDIEKVKARAKQRKDFGRWE